MQVLGLESKNSQPSHFSIPEDIMTDYTKLQKVEILHKAAAQIVDKFVFGEDSLGKMIDQVITAQGRQEVIDSQTLTADGRFPCRYEGCGHSFKYDGKRRQNHEMSHQPPPYIPPPVSICPSSKKPDVENKEEQTDDLFNYNCALMTDGLFFFNFLDATSEGDGLRTLRQYKYMLLYCKADNQHSFKYGLECLYQFFLVFAILSPRDRERFTWNRSINNGGGVGKNVALDLDVEHSNNYLKQAIKNLGPNLTENAVSRIGHAELGARTIMQSMDKNLEKISGSGKHSHSSAECDLSELVKRIGQLKVFDKEIGRRYIHYSNFERDPFHNLNISTIYKWINQHKKNVDIGIRAR